MKFLLAFIFSVCTFFAFSQQPASSNGIQQIITSVNNYNATFPAEQLYLHFDKKNYAVDDTLWFKAYIADHSTHAYSSLSGLLYVEIIADNNKVIKRLSFPAAYGVSWGQVPLDKEDVPEGNYTVRAYTNWMQNFGEDYFFYQKITVVNDDVQSHWFIKENHIITSESDKDNVDFTLQLNSLQNQPAKQKQFILKVLDGKKTIYKDERQTNAAGVLNGKFSLPVNTAKEVNILLVDEADTSRRSIVPIYLNRPQNIDLQFMPEGGSMVAGITSRVGFKAIEENGLGIDVKGIIANSKNLQVASFASLHKGMGVVEFTPVEGETYTAIINSPVTKRFQLPAIKNSGIVLELDNDQNADHIKLTITCSPDLVNKQYYIFGLSRGVVCYAANINFGNTVVHGSIAKSLFPSGIAHFTLMNALQQPLNERMLFIDHSDNLNVTLSANNIFSVRDSIPLHISVTDNMGKPVTGSFSLSVTDDAQVKNDSVDQLDIVTKMLLSADVKGNIEQPAYYLNNKDDLAWRSLDALLLTQGWIGYDWTKINKPPTPLFSAQPAFSITGKVTNLFNSPINKAHVVLMSSGSNFNVRDTVTNKNGEFVFTNFKRFDSSAFVIDARNAKDKKFGIGLAVNEFKPAAFTLMPAVELFPWYVNSDSTIQNFTKDQQVIESQLGKGGRYKTLNEVKINARKVIKGSSNLNGGGADQIIDQAEIEKETGKKKSLLQLLKEKVKGFIEIPMGDRYAYRINSSNVFFIVDGINLHRFTDNVKDALEYLDAEDITGIEVMLNSRYTSNYKSTFFDLGQQMDIRGQHAFIEITTRSGNGIFFKKSPGVVIYKPIPVIFPRQFYSPKYTVKNINNKIKDLRSTIYWNPEIITDKNGEANIYFYAADTPTTYTLNFEGSNLNGSVGYKFQKISVQ